MDVIRFPTRVKVGGRHYRAGEDIKVEDATEYLPLGATLILHEEPEKADAEEPEKKPRQRRAKTARG